MKILLVDKEKKLELRTYEDGTAYILCWCKSYTGGLMHLWDSSCNTCHRVFPDSFLALQAFVNSGKRKGAFSPFNRYPGK